MKRRPIFVADAKTPWETNDLLDSSSYVVDDYVVDEACNPSFIHRTEQNAHTKCSYEENGVIAAVFASPLLKWVCAMSAHAMLRAQKSLKDGFLRKKSASGNRREKLGKP